MVCKNIRKQTKLHNLLGPTNVEHLKVILDNAYFFLLMCLVEVFQNDGDVHVDDNHVVDDDETSEVDY